MSDSVHRTVDHDITVNAPATDVFRLIADVQNWPRLFPPTVHVDEVERSGDVQRIRIWATANDEVKSWTSRRVLTPAELKIDFRQEIPAPPVAAMGGTWLVEPRSDGASTVRLRHDYRAVDDDAEKLAWIDAAVDRNSRTELAALKANAELAINAGLTCSFADTVRIDGSVKDVYDFMNHADLWSQRLPHVSRVVLTEETPGVQTLEMDTLTKDGSSHTTKSVRICFPHSRIVYKQITLPALLGLHTGYWDLAEDGTAVTATSQHTVVIKPEAVTAVLGPGSDITQARDFVRTALSTNSLATLGHAKTYAESRR